LDFVAQGKVQVMTETYPFDQVQQAYERVEQGKARFRAVLNFLNVNEFNVNEPNRHWFDAIIDPVAHRESDLLADRDRAVVAGPGHVRLQQGQWSLLLRQRQLVSHLSCSSAFLKMWKWPRGT
jgi:hypothetical protein